jgi:hypothetical protein
MLILPVILGTLGKLFNLRELKSLEELDLNRWHPDVQESWSVDAICTMLKGVALSLRRVTCFVCHSQFHTGNYDDKAVLTWLEPVIKALSTVPHQSITFIVHIKSWGRLKDEEERDGVIAALNAIKEDIDASNLTIELQIIIPDYEDNLTKMRPEFRAEFERRSLIGGKL